MPNYPTAIQMMPYSQKPNYLGIQWEAPAGTDVEHYELFICPKTVGNNEISALLSGAKEREGVVKVVFPAGCLCALDNRTTQGARNYYTVFAVGKDGGFVQAKFKMNDAPNMNLSNPVYLKEPYYPCGLKLVPYGQKPDGIGISWKPMTGDWESYAVVTLTNKNISKPEEFEMLFLGQLDFGKLHKVGTNVTEAIDDATPQGARSYYSVVAIDKKGNIREVDNFQTVEAGNAKFTNPVRLSGAASAAPSPPAAPAAAQPAQAIPAIAMHVQAAPAPMVKAPSVAPAPVSAPQPRMQTATMPSPAQAAARPLGGAKYPDRLNLMPMTQDLYGVRLRLKEPRPQVSGFKLVLSTKSFSDTAAALEGRMEGVRVFELPPDTVEVAENTTEPGERRYYALLGLDAGGNLEQVPYEINRAREPALGNARWLDPNIRWPLPTVDADWLLKTMEKGIEPVAFDSGGRIGADKISVFSNQPWEGCRFKIKKPHANYVRYQMLISGDYITRPKLVEAVQGRSKDIRMYEIPKESLELIDNVSEENKKYHYACVGWDKEGNAYWVELDFPSTQHAGFKGPHFVDPGDLARVKRVADGLLAEGRKLLASIGGDKQALFNSGPQALQQGQQAGMMAILAYPMYEDIQNFSKELQDKAGWLEQAQLHFSCGELLKQAEDKLKGEGKPYANPHYSGVEGDLKTARENQGASRKQLQDHLTRCPWSGSSAWYPERLKQLDANDAAMKDIGARMEKLKARDAKAKALYDEAKKAHAEAKYDEAVHLYEEVMKVKPEWETHTEIQRARDDKEFDGQVAAAGKALSNFVAMYDDWMKRDKSDYAWRALRKAHDIIADRESFLLYERRLMKAGYYDDVVSVFRQTKENRQGFVEGIFGADKVNAAAIQTEELENEIYRIQGTIRDHEQKLSELQHEDSKLVGTGFSDYRRNLENDMQRVRNEIERNRSRWGELSKKMALVLADLFGSE
jgi:hypothetical protein